MTYMHNGMKLKKKLKDPNAKGPLDKFAPIFAAVGLAYAVVNGGFSLFDFFTKGGAQKAQEERIEKYIQEQVDEEIRLRFPQVSGPVLRTQKENKQWTDFINKDKKNGPTNP